MKLVSVNVGLPKEIQWNGGIVRTSIFKSPVNTPVRVARLNLDGDQQSDLTVHGGPDKAVYAYPSEHYPFWRENYPAVDFQWGALGENFTTEGLLEPSIKVGDRLVIGSAEFVVTQPRLPCFKLGIRLNNPAAIRKLLQSRKTGFYLAVLKEGVVTAGDAIERIGSAENGLSLRDIVDLYAGTLTEPRLLQSAMELPALPASWRDHFRKRLSQQ
jgi:MOSC domain-containing protein YiiM